MTTRENISVIIITKNESKNIRRCLESVKWADEIVVLDSGSTDDTVSICHEFTQHVFVTDWPGFGVQKQRALEKAAHEWVLWIDADEEVTPELKSEILAVLNNGTGYDGFYMPRTTLFCGEFLKHGKWSKDRVLRFFKKSKSYFTSDVVHEAVVVNGALGKFSGFFLHYCSYGLEDLLEKVRLYSLLGAEKAQKKGKRSTFLRAILHAQWTFIRCYFLGGAFLAGRLGFLSAIISTHTCFYKYAQLALLQDKD